MSFNVKQYGATGDGVTLDTRALQDTIEAATRAGGGSVWVPAGKYVTGSLFLRDNVALWLEPGATLLGSENPADYSLVTMRWEGITRETYAPLITAAGARNIAVMGRGTIDGRGAVWWRGHREKSLAYPRPRLIAFDQCRDVLIENVILTNSPAWTINPVRCENVTIDKVTIVNPPDSPNTDGINPDSCRNVHISNCHIDVGDDCVTLKSGIEKEAADLRTPCENITITNCTMVHGHGGVVIGSEMSGGVRNVVISNCVFTGTDRGIRLKSRRGRGGVVEDVCVTNLVMQDVLCPFTMNLYYHVGVKGNRDIADKQAHPVDAGTPQFRRIRCSHISVREAQYAAAFLYGLPEMPVEDVSFEDVSIAMAMQAQPGAPDMADDIEPMCRAGFFARNVRGLHLERVTVTNQVGEAFLVEG